MSLLERAAREAASIVERRLAPDSPLREHETLVRILAAEGYACGYLTGLEAAQERLDDLYRATRSELDDDD